MRLSDPKFSIQDMASHWVHPTVDCGSQAFACHARFISHAVIAGVVGLSLFPVLLAVQQSISPLEIALIAALGTPLAIASFVSRTGAIERGKQVALLVLASLIAGLVSAAGGFQSIYVLALCIIPLEAVLWRCSSPVRLVLVAALVSTAILFAAGASTTVVIAETGTIAIIGLTTLAYVASLIYRIVNQRSAADQGRATQDDRLALLSEFSSELITRHDANGSTLFASPAARTLFGVPAKELLEGGLVSRVHLQDRVVLLKSISDTAQSQSKQTCQLRIRFNSDDDRAWKWVEMDCNPVPDKRTGKTTVACVTRDRSKLHELEQELQQINGTADELNRSQRRFLATMSHELRTPLNAIVGFSDILKQELFGPLGHEKYRDHVSLISDSGAHLLSVVNDILDQSKIESGRYELSVSTFSIADIADATIAMLQPIAEKGQVSIRNDIGADVPEISADRRACQQILINLLSNAVKFSPEGGDVCVSAKTLGRNVKIEVRDNGIGIDPAFMATICEPFTQADNGSDRQYEGSGLGLSVVTGLVELHHGELNIESTPGRGTVVTITLPTRASTSNPVPNDNTSQLVHLRPDSIQINHSELVNSSVSKGDNRARVSA